MYYIEELTSKAMTIERKKVPPIVPKKNRELSLRGDKNGSETLHLSIPVGPITPRIQDRETTEKETLERLVEEISLNSEYELPRRHRNEPKVIKFDYIMASNRVPAIKPTKHASTSINTITNTTTKPKPQPKPKPVLESLLQQESPDIYPKQNATPQDTLWLNLKPKPLVKPKPPVKTKPEIKPSFHCIQHPLSKTCVVPPQTRTEKETPAFLHNVLQQHIDLQSKSAPLQMVPLPGLATSAVFPIPAKPSQRAHTVDNSSLGVTRGSGKKLTHPNKTRSRGPRRRLPKSVSTSEGDKTSANAPTYAAKCTETPLLSQPLGKKKPPVPPKKKIQITV